MNFLAAMTADSDDGAFFDRRTGLCWRRGLGAVIAGEQPTGGDGLAGLYTWDEARQAVEAFNRAGGQAGYQDWRLPTRGELKRLLEPANGWSPPLRRAIGPAGRFWSARAYAGHSRYAWCVDVTGRASYLSRRARLQVWLVRSGSRQ